MASDPGDELVSKRPGSRPLGCSGTILAGAMVQAIGLKATTLYLASKGVDYAAETRLSYVVGSPVIIPVNSVDTIQDDGKMVFINFKIKAYDQE